MSLVFHGHPLSSYCWKVLIALYELEAPFEPVVVNLGDPQARDEFLKFSPFGKMPAITDARGVAVYETSIIIDYLDQHHPGRSPLIPADSEAAREVRLRDRVFDLHVHNVFQSIINDRLRPEGTRDSFGVDRARVLLNMAYEVLDRDLAGRTWAAGEAFSMADCAAAPALFYADLIEPIGEGRPVLSAYLRRLRARPSVARAIAEAQPFLQYYPATPEERTRLVAQGLG